MTEPAVDVEKNFQESIEDYNYLLFLMNRPGNEELMGIYDVVLEKINSSTTKTITETEFDDITKNYTWFKDFDADKQIAEIAIAEDLANGTNLYEQKVLKRRGELAEDANLYGISFTEEQLTEIANKAEYDAYTAKELKTFLRDEVSFDGTQDLTGQAGDTQQALQQWSARNGLQIPADSLNNLIKSGAFGDQSFEDMKQQLRKTYLMGAFPGWEKEIAAGADPYDLAAPYRASLASVLEMNEEDISFDDDLLSQAMQTKMTITDLKREARKDPRWDKTENALKTYTDAGTNILQMFGLR
jgi:hypothetical protein